MGTQANVGMNCFPKQGTWKDKPVSVIFDYDTEDRINGTIVRDDWEDPFITIIKLEDVHLAQGLNYLQAYKIDKGLLINFGSRSLEIKRLFRK